MKRQAISTYFYNVTRGVFTVLLFASTYLFEGVFFLTAMPSRSLLTFVCFPKIISVFLGGIVAYLAYALFLTLFQKRYKTVKK